jgi:hypothetical protein
VGILFAYLSVTTVSRPDNIGFWETWSATIPRCGFHDAVPSSHGMDFTFGHGAVPHPARFHGMASMNRRGGGRDDRLRRGCHGAIPTNPPFPCPQFHARPRHPRSATMRFHVQFRNRRYRTA